MTANTEAAVPLTFTYRNWRGETSERRVLPLSVRFGSTEWHPEPQWLMLARDLGKGEPREFAMRDMQFAAAPHLVAAVPDAAVEAAMPAGWKLVPIEPTDGLLLSMALRNDHGLLMPSEMKMGWQRDVPTEQLIASAISSMRQLHEEVVGTGFYSPERDARYLEMRDEAIAKSAEIRARSAAPLPPKTGSGI